MKVLPKILLKIAGVVLLFILILNIFVYIRTPEIKLSKSIPEIDAKREARMLTSFFGLDELPPISILFSWTAPGKNGMPVVFSQEVDPETLDPTDFEITTSSGSKHFPDVVTLLPANEEFELRTVLMIGEYGTMPL